MRMLVLFDEIGVKKASEQLGIDLLTLKYWWRNRNKKSKEEKTDGQSDKQKLTRLGKRTPS